MCEARGRIRLDLALEHRDFELLPRINILRLINDSVINLPDTTPLLRVVVELFRNRLQCIARLDLIGLMTLLLLESRLGGRVRVGLEIPGVSSLFGMFGHICLLLRPRVASAYVHEKLGQTRDQVTLNAAVLLNPVLIQIPIQRPHTYAQPLGRHLPIATSPPQRLDHLGACCLRLAAARFRDAAPLRSPPRPV